MGAHCQLLWKLDNATMNKSSSKTAGNGHSRRSFRKADCHYLRWSMARGKSPPNSAKLHNRPSKLHTSMTVQLCPPLSACMELTGHWNVQKLLPVLAVKNISYLSCQFQFILHILRLDLSVKLGVCCCCTGAGCVRKPSMTIDESSESNQAGFKYYHL